MERDPSHHMPFRCPLGGRLARAAALTTPLLLASLAAQETKAVDRSAVDRPAVDRPAVDRSAAVVRLLKEKLGDSGAGVCVAWIGARGKSAAVAHGMADREGKRVMTTSDRLLSGSIGKTYVATVALQLVAEKKLELDAKVSAYLGKREWFGRLPNAADLTIRSLLNHTSGIKRYVFDKDFLAVVAKEKDKVWKPEELLGYVFDTEPQFAVGKGWAYADTNYIVLGVVLEQILGKSYYAALRERVLKPFGLRDTVPSDGPKIPKLVPGYTSTGRMFGIANKTIQKGRFVINPQFEWTGGGLACTTADLAKWARIFGTGAKLPAALRNAQRDGVKARLGRGARYGLGAILLDTKHGAAIGHSGFMPGYVSEMRYYPKLDLAVAIQFNTDHRLELSFGTGGYLDAVVDILARKNPVDAQKKPVRRAGN